MKDARGALRRPLSEYQARFLVWVLEVEKNYPPSPADRGVRVARHGAGTSRSEAASMSRAVKRLEDRGLIRRRNAVSGDRYGRGGKGDIYDGTKQVRTTAVELTDAGRVVAEALLVAPGALVNSGT